MREGCFLWLVQTVLKSECTLVFALSRESLHIVFWIKEKEEAMSNTITEQDVRALGLPQIAARHAISALVAQAIRREALASLLSEAGEDFQVQQKILHVCTTHVNARWWLLDRRPSSVLASIHWSEILEEEVRVPSSRQSREDVENTVCLFLFENEHTFHSHR